MNGSEDIIVESNIFSVVVFVFLFRNIVVIIHVDVQ